ncbi:MAG: DUF45 domain-containing protein [Helicobacteraceae bacterium]|nr:DUF45 domain-containing protein [Helicobacteraceae bacterium]
MKELKYIKHYSQETQNSVYTLIEKEQLGIYLSNKYTTQHSYKTDKTLFFYVNELKNLYLKKSAPLSKVLYDSKINVVHNALGTHHFISRVQGSKLKAKNEIRIASMFKNLPQEFLEMIVVHEIAHFKVKEHNKAFYKLCSHMQSKYHQVEFDLRVYLTHLDFYGKIESWNS